jgi:cation diffusion facilitator family transporter
MLASVRDWLGFGSHGLAVGHGHGHGHAHHHGDEGHGHTHGVIDPTIATTARGIWAVKWSFVILAVTAAAQLVIVVLSGSVALLADTIHNVGDAVTAIPLWIAFVLVRRPPSRRFTYGLGRVEDIAGLFIVGIILFSALVAGREAIARLIEPQPIAYLGWVAAAGVVGFLGNEAVAVFRIRVGREISSAALVADGYHARTDGFTSLAVVLGAIGVWAGFPLADPIIGLLITLAIFGIVWQSARAVVTRMLDGVEPEILDEIDHVGEHVAGIHRVHAVQARWIGHRLHAELSVQIDPGLPLGQAQQIVSEMRRELFEHLPVLSQVSIRIEAPAGAAVGAPRQAHTHPLHAPEPFVFDHPLAAGTLAIIDTPEGERMRLLVSRHAEGLSAAVVIDRADGPETLDLVPDPDNHHAHLSQVAPAEPHAFAARLILSAEGRSEILRFAMAEPEGHHRRA